MVIFGKTRWKGETGVTPEEAMVEPQQGLLSAKVKQLVTKCQTV